MKSVGIKLVQNCPLELRESVELARYAEAQGLDSVWTYEYQADAVVPMTAYALATERLKIGSAIIPFYTRSVPLLGMTIANLESLAPGRVLFGVGTSTEVIIERWHGQRRTRPLLTAEEGLRALREILAGGRVEIAGESISIEGFQLERPRLAAPDAAIYAAALGSRMLRLAGELADGALLNLTPFSYTPAVRGIVDEGSAAAGRAPGTVALAGDIRVAIAEGEAASEIRERQRREIAYYGKVKPYNRFFAEAGFEAQAAALTAAWEARDRDRAFACVDDEMLDSVMLIGDERHVLDGLQHALAQGLDHAIIYPLWPAQESPQAAMRSIIDVLAKVDRKGRQASEPAGAAR